MIVPVTGPAVLASPPAEVDLAGVLLAERDQAAAVRREAVEPGVEDGDPRDRPAADEHLSARGRPEDGPDYTGVWVGERKIASIGVHLARGVTTHGFAVNVENDLQPFEWIVPCGLEGVRMTSLIKETGRTAGQLKCFRRRAAWRVAQELGRRQRLVSLARLEEQAGALAPVEAQAGGRAAVEAQTSAFSAVP